MDILSETREISDNNSVFSDNSHNIEINELKMLISQLLNSNLNAYKYLHIENEISKGAYRF
ncbi:5708_t:CDS:2 [Funneliformis mosseae]|uniref:5708_t:CDS:1 n=1 Tax=Funneliformis mosseae TaxID=27381 RepID=A0A9N8VC64_FUNMO|nr:5708_t:CDS:2 [Funneliformis mosseae]